MILKIPLTIKGATDLLKSVYARSSNPFYIKIDVGPQCCKKDYIIPDYEKINKLLSDYNKGIRVEKLWLGPESAYKRFYEVAHELISSMLSNCRRYFEYIKTKKEANRESYN